MKPESQIKTVAQLDGKEVPFCNCDIDNECYNECLELYNEELKELDVYSNRDTLISVIEKVCNVDDTPVTQKFIDALCKIKNCDPFSYADGLLHYLVAFELLKSTNEELREAILRATGKWIEE